MRLTIRANGQVRAWVARTKRGFNAKQKKEILEFRKAVGLIARESATK